MKKLCVGFAVVLSLVSAHAQSIVIDANSPGRIFEGVGGLSAGASSRLLIDYPDPYRSYILDYLFKPNFGASLQHLKVEIPGNINGTDGTEPSHAFTRAEFDNPCKAYFERGYEWWLMKEAKARRADIIFDCLQWGAPAWIGNGNFFSKDNADYVASFINGARRYHSLNIRYAGIWNESGYEKDYICLLRKTLNDNNCQDVAIVAADDTRRKGWRIADDIENDANVSAAVSVIGVHYPGVDRKNAPVQTWHSPDNARNSGKPLWSSEEGAWRNDWQGAAMTAMFLNRNYIHGKITKNIIWALITSYYNILPFTRSGLMQATTPWSGNYEVCPTIWAVAHTTQFAQPGWRYLDSGCGLLEKGGSFVTLASPNQKDYSVIIETMDAFKPQEVKIEFEGVIGDKILHVWRTSQQTEFVKLDDDTKAVDGEFILTVDPYSIYSITTTTGQQKGKAPNAVPAAFPFPYYESFENYSVEQLPKYTCDQGGIFMVAERADGKGKCLRQMVLCKGIEWGGHKDPEPYTILGSADWKDYQVSCDVLIEKSGYAALFGRVFKSPQKPICPVSYWLKLQAEGKWQLMHSAEVIDSGIADVKPDRWHNIKLRFNGTRIRAFIDGKQVTEVKRPQIKPGMAGLGSGWNNVCFDNFKIEELE